MRRDKIKAYELRRKNKSYSEIGRLLNIPKSTLATWFQNEDWSREIRDKLGAKESLAFPKKMAAIIKANKERWEGLRHGYRTTAEKEFNKLKDRPLFLAGLMLYWGEGSKSPKKARVHLANVDPAMIKLFYKFLRDEVGVPANKIYIWLLLYPDLADEMQKRFWSTATGIPISQFKSSIYIKGRHPTKRLSYGVCNIYVLSREYYEKIMTWLSMAQNMLIQ